MSSTNPIRVGVWGLGRHARRNILPALGATNATELVGVTTRRREVAEEEAARYHCKAWADPAEMLADPFVDAVYVATPIGHHVEQGCLVLRAGKHLWCEKSLTATEAETVSLVELSRARELAICEAFMYRYHPHFEALRELVADPAFGRVLSLSCRFGMAHQDPTGFRYSSSRGGGALLDVGCYPLDAALNIVGGNARIVCARLEQPAPFEVDTEGFAVLKFGSGAHAFLEWGFGRSYRNEIMVWGERGSLYSDRIFSKMEDFHPSIQLRDERGTVETRAVEPANAFVAMFAKLAEAVSDSEACEHHRQAVIRQARHMAALAAYR